MMGAYAQQQLYVIKQDLQNIINELDDIASGISRDFEGIGNEKCALRVYKIAQRYRYVKEKLNHIDTSKVTEQFANSHSGTVRP